VIGHQNLLADSAATPKALSFTLPQYTILNG
jgi:hypothetical protein